MLQTCVNRLHRQALHSCAQGDSLRHALELDRLARRQPCHHRLEHLQATSKSIAGTIVEHTQATR